MHASNWKPYSWKSMRLRIGQMNILIGSVALDGASRWGTSTSTKAPHPTGITHPTNGAKRVWMNEEILFDTELVDRVSFVGFSP